MTNLTINVDELREQFNHADFETDILYNIFNRLCDIRQNIIILER